VALMIKILVVEDDKALNGLISTCLRDAGYEVESLSTEDKEKCDEQILTLTEQLLNDKND
jgi:DNA-binding response OmpR family regulator